MLGLAGGTSTAATDDTAEPARSAVSVPVRAMDAVAAMQPCWSLGNTTSGLAVPTAFNGDRPATMEAVYAHGTNAGPHDWTSFKEFVAFTPEHAAGEITPSQRFFDDVDDNSNVTLTFHP